MTGAQQPQESPLTFFKIQFQHGRVRAAFDKVAFSCPVCRNSLWRESCSGVYVCGECGVQFSLTFTTLFSPEVVALTKDAGRVP